MVHWAPMHRQICFPQASVAASPLSARTFFNHQRKFLFPTVLHHWDNYVRNGLLEQAREHDQATWSGDGRYDSMGHNAKYGAYTMFCNTISKLIHFELLQVSQI